MKLPKFVSKVLSDIKEGVDDFNLNSEIDSNSMKAIYPNDIKFSVDLSAFKDEIEIIHGRTCDDNSGTKVSFVIEWANTSYFEPFTR